MKVKSPQKSSDALNTVKSNKRGKISKHNASITNYAPNRRSSRLSQREKGISFSTSSKAALIPDCKDDVCSDASTREYDEPVFYEPYFEAMKNNNVSSAVAIRMLELSDDLPDKALKAFAADNSLPSKLQPKKVDLIPWTLKEISILINQIINSSTLNEEDKMIAKKGSWENQKLQAVASMISKPLSTVLNVYYLLKNEICHHRVKLAFCEDIQSALESSNQQPFGCFEKLLSYFFIREENECRPSSSSAAKPEIAPITVLEFGATDPEIEVKHDETATFKYVGIKMEKTNEMYNEAFKIGNEGAKRSRINNFTELWLLGSIPYWKCTKCVRKILLFVCHQDNVEKMRNHIRNHIDHPLRAKKVKKC